MLDVANPFFTDVARGIEHGCRATTTSSLFLCTSNNDGAREAAHLEQLRQQRVQGILVTPVDAVLAAARRHRPAHPAGHRRPHPWRRLVLHRAADDVVGGRQALEHLIDQGHDRVAYIGGPEALGQVRDRKLGASLAWEKAGLPPDDLLTITTPALGFADGRAAGERLAGVPKRRRPTAAFCANDLVALGLLQHVILSGLRVPDDLAIVGFDDIDFAGAAAVPLTSVRQPRHELGRAAAELLLDEADNPDHVHQQISFTPELVGAGVDGRLTPIAAPIPARPPPALPRCA